MELTVESMPRRVVGLSFVFILKLSVSVSVFHKIPRARSSV